ncbi:MAG TPA: hypothetical protein VJ396_02080 [Acidiferrobacterales bacterium]|nr:hypothetical protein [Acidiferrobacterales bacterium]
MAVIPQDRTAAHATMPDMNRLPLLIGLLVLLLSGCRGERASPEAEVRAPINGAVTAAEQKRIPFKGKDRMGMGVQSR